MVINHTINGKVFKCSKCNAIHIEYKNLNFNFSESDFEDFVMFFEELDVEECARLNQTTSFRRSIVIPIGHKNFNMLFDKNELYEFKELLLQASVDGVGLELIDNKQLTDIQYIN